MFEQTPDTEATMGGKPSKGTPADRRLKANQPPAKPAPKMATPKPAAKGKPRGSARRG